MLGGLIFSVSLRGGAWPVGVCILGGGEQFFQGLPLLVRVCVWLEKILARGLSLLVMGGWWGLFSILQSFLHLDAYGPKFTMVQCNMGRGGEKWWIIFLPALWRLTSGGTVYGFPELGLTTKGGIIHS